MPNTLPKFVPARNLKSRILKAESLSIPGEESWYVRRTDPAISVMTDFRSRSSVTIKETDTLDEAISHMKHAGVRCAFVTDKRHQSVVGMITAYDMLGEKPQQFMDTTGLSHDKVTVRDLMTRTSDWHVIDLHDLEKSTVLDVLQIFEETHDTHLPVMETSQDNELRLRGLLSYANVKRVLLD